jgi:hypothetical protein
MAGGWRRDWPRLPSHRDVNPRKTPGRINLSRYIGGAGELERRMIKIELPAGVMERARLIARHNHETLTALVERLLTQAAPLLWIPPGGTYTGTQALTAAAKALRDAAQS